MNICTQKHIQPNKDERTEFFRKIYLTVYWKGCVWEVSWRLNRDCNILTPPPAPPAIAVRLFRSPGPLNMGPGGQPLCWKLVSTARSGKLTSSSELQLPDFLSHPGYIIVLWPLNSTRRQSKLSPDLFDRMHLLFTRVHFSFDSLAGSEVNMQHRYLNSLGKY